MQLQSQQNDMRKIDLNCDMGESTSLWLYDINDDISILPYISSINIATGFHAGDPDTAKILIGEACKGDIAIGAHPSFPDRENFGRLEMLIDESELSDMIYEQVDFVASLALSNGIKIQHVKPHGALYNMAAMDYRLALIVCTAIQNFDEDLVVYGLSGSEIIKVAGSIGLKSCNEAFADRTYREDGSLTPRAEAGALIVEAEQCIQQVLQMVTKGTVCARNGKVIPIKAETICIHSDGPHALKFAKKIHQTMLQQGIQVSHL
jgi:UPF0271 protein